MECWAPTSPGSHEHFMARALELAERGRSFTAPNPCVGAVLVKGGQVVAEGWHRRFGGPHAEVECLAEAQRSGVNPAECTMYVTLEPCNHHGKTPPCSQAVLASGVTSVVVGCADPNPLAGGGIQTLRDGGVDVSVGVLEQQCRDAIADFVVWQTTQRPYVILKLAQTLDGKIAAQAATPEAVSGPESHRRVHELRSKVEAVLVGGGTFRADNPQLTCRLEGFGGPGSDQKQPWAVVVTGSLPQAGGDACLLTKRARSTIFLTTTVVAESEAAEALRGLGCRVLGLGQRDGGLDINAGLAALRRDFGVHAVLCEGGGGLAMTMLEQGLADEIKLFLSPKVLGDATAVASFHGREGVSMAEAHGLRFAGARPSGEDLELTLRPKEKD